MFSKKKLGENVKMLRREKGITQEELSQITETTRTQVSDIENGKSSTSINIIWNLAEYFNVSIDYLLGRTEDNSPFRKENNE